MPTTPNAAAIREAANQISTLAPAFAERFVAARNLLLRGGWSCDWTCQRPIVRFADGQAVSDDRCSCQDGGHIVCIHAIAARILAVAGQQEREVAA